LFENNLATLENFIIAKNNSHIKVEQNYAYVETLPDEEKNMLQIIYDNHLLTKTIDSYVIISIVVIYLPGI
jgi:hypothetical protein